MNTNKKIILALFIFVALIQITLPISMIVRREMTLKYGTEYRFKTMPVDPYDAFRGRYVFMRVESDWLLLPDEIKPRYNQKVFVTIEEGKDGFAKMSNISLNKPHEGDFLKVKISNIDYDVSREPKRVMVSLPFDRYYMEEEAAPLAEKAYIERVDSGSVIIKIKSGFGVVESLYIGQERIEDYIKKSLLLFMLNSTCV